ncbi:MAG TPA: DUF4337 domain-containing protein [Xanthobacteraceae bacterium]|jgi:hypothetical protein
MPGSHEQLEHAEHVEHAAHSNKKIALVIAFLVLGLALSETLGKSAQTSALTDNIRSSDTWSFFQAKTVRQTTLRTAAQAMALLAAGATSDESKAAIGKQVDAWNTTVARYESEPETGEGRKELMARAKAAERDRDLALARYHQYELASAAYQIGIVLASTAIITGIMALAYTAGGLGALGIAFMALGLFAPEATHEAMHWVEQLSAGGAH